MRVGEEQKGPRQTNRRTHERKGLSRRHADNGAASRPVSQECQMIRTGARECQETSQCHRSVKERDSTTREPVEEGSVTK